MEPFDREQLEHELHYDEEWERWRNRYKIFYFPRVPEGRRFISGLVIILWLVMLALTYAVVDEPTTVSGTIAFFVVAVVEAIVAAAFARWVWTSIGPVARSVVRPLIRHWYLTLLVIGSLLTKIAAPFVVERELDKRRAHGATEAEIGAGVTGATQGATWRILTAADHGYLQTSHAQAAEACAQAGAHLPNAQEAKAVAPELRVPPRLPFWLREPERNAHAFEVMAATRDMRALAALMEQTPTTAAALCMLTPIPAPEATSSSRSHAHGATRAALPTMASGTDMAGFARVGRAPTLCDKDGTTLEERLLCRAAATAAEQELTAEVTQRAAELRALTPSVDKLGLEAQAGLAYALSLTAEALPPDDPMIVRLLAQGTDDGVVQLTERAIFHFARRNPAAARAHAQRLNDDANLPSLRLTHALAAGGSAPEACAILGRIAVRDSALSRRLDAALADLPAACARVAASAAERALAELPVDSRTFKARQLSFLGAAASAVVAGLPADLRQSQLWMDLVEQEQARRLGEHSTLALAAAAKAEPGLLTKRPCKAEDFGLRKKQQVPFEVDVCYTTKRPELFPRDVPVFRPL